MGCGFTSKAKHLFRLRKLEQGIEEQSAAAAALTTEAEHCAAASKIKQKELREDISLTQQQVTELNESWGVMREMYETSKRMKKMREKALMRKVLGRFMYATLAMCLKEWAALTFRRKRLAAKHEWQAKVEDLEFEEKSLCKRLSDISNKLHFVRDQAQADRVRALVARMGFRSLGMWFLMWRAYLKVSADERRADELSRLRQAIEDTKDHSARLAKKVADQVDADERMSAQVDGMVAADAARHNSIVPAVLDAAVVAEGITKRQVATYPSESRSNGLHAQMDTLRRSGLALAGMRGIADEVLTTSTTTLPAIESAVPLTPSVPTGSLSRAWSPQPPSGSLNVEESIVNDLSTSNVGDMPVVPQAHQRSRPFSSRGRTLVQPKIDNVRNLEFSGRGDLSLPGAAGAMRGSLRRRFAGPQASSAIISTSLRQELGASKMGSPRPAVQT